MNPNDIYRKIESQTNFHTQSITPHMNIAILTEQGFLMYEVDKIATHNKGGRSPMMAFVKDRAYLVTPTNVRRATEHDFGLHTDISSLHRPLREAIYRPSDLDMQQVRNLAVALPKKRQENAFEEMSEWVA